MTVTKRAIFRADYHKRIFNFGIFVNTLHVFMFSVVTKCR